MIVKGPSMEPTLHTGNVIHLKRGLSKYKVGDIIVFKKKHCIYVKRIKFTSGYYFTQKIPEGHDIDIIYTYISEYYCNEFKKNPFSELYHQHFIKFDNAYWVSGDNIMMSENSEFYGPVYKKEIIGKVDYIFYL